MSAFEYHNCATAVCPGAAVNVVVTAYAVVEVFVCELVVLKFAFKLPVMDPLVVSLAFTPASEIPVVNDWERLAVIPAERPYEVEVVPVEVRVVERLNVCVEVVVPLFVSVAAAVDALLDIFCVTLLVTIDALGTRTERE